MITPSRSTTQSSPTAPKRPTSSGRVELQAAAPDAASSMFARSPCGDARAPCGRHTAYRDPGNQPGTTPLESHPNHLLCPARDGGIEAQTHEPRSAGEVSKDRLNSGIGANAVTAEATRRIDLDGKIRLVILAATTS